MGNVMAYSGLTTKIRAMQAKLLTQADYETISGFTDVVQVVEFLKTKPAYAVYMDQLELAHLHRGDIEKMLYQSLYNDYTRIFRFAGIDQKKFLKIYWKKYEVSVINYCLRIVFNHYDKPYDLDYKKEFFDKYSNLSFDKLISSTNIEELVDKFRGSEYYEALKPIRDSGAATLFDYDQALELYYFTNYWRRTDYVDETSNRYDNRRCRGNIIYDPVFHLLRICIWNAPWNPAESIRQRGSAAKRSTI